MRRVLTTADREEILDWQKPSEAFAELLEASASTP